MNDKLKLKDRAVMARNLHNYLQEAGQQSFARAFYKMYLELEGAELDAEYYQAIVEGSWPNADSLIQRIRNAPLMQ